MLLTLGVAPAVGRGAAVAAAGTAQDRKMGRKVAAIRGSAEAWTLGGCAAG